MIEPCPLCNSLISNEHLKTGTSRLLQCSSCGLVVTEDAGAGERLYESDEYFVEKHGYVEKWDEFCRLFDTLLDKVIRYKSGGSFLDVGCGVGCLVSCAAERGFSAQGVEVSKWAATFAREAKHLNVTTGTLEESLYDPGSFDVVIINHVLEHVPDPAGLLCEARRILKDDGLLVVGVPNIGSIMARLARAEWASLRPEEHRWHFTPDTIKSLMAKTGFRCIRFEAKDNYPVIGWGLKPMLRRLINWFAVVSDYGEAMLVFAVKADGDSL